MIPATVEDFFFWLLRGFCAIPQWGNHHIRFPLFETRNPGHWVLSFERKNKYIRKKDFKAHVSSALVTPPLTFYLIVIVIGTE